MPIILAHGALGPYDEIIFAAVGIVFLVMMGVSWFRSRNEPLDDEDETGGSQDAQPQAQDADRFRLQ